MPSYTVPNEPVPSSAPRLHDRIFLLNLPFGEIFLLNMNSVVELEVPVKPSGESPSLISWDTGGTIGGGGLSGGGGRTALCASHSAIGMPKSSGPDKPRLWQRRRMSPLMLPLPPMRRLRVQAADPARASEAGAGRSNCSNSKGAGARDLLILLDDWRCFSDNVLAQ